MLLVESAQSVANRLEKTVIDGEGTSLDPALAGLPYVEAELHGLPDTVTTSSLVEAHRIGSPYFLLNKDFQAALVTEMGYHPKLPLNWKKIYATLFKYDPNSLIHGVFLSLLEGGRVRAPRALTGFIEAENVQKVLSGGVKNSPVDPTGKTQVADAKASEPGVYSNVPYARVEYTAQKITGYFNLDLGLIRGYGLGDAATNLIVSLALLKVRRFLDGSLRLRTACDLQLVGMQGFELPEPSMLLNDVKAGINACAGQFAKPPVTLLKTKVKMLEKTKEASA
jgi:CRISPR-associated protein Csb1